MCIFHDWKIIKEEVITHRHDLSNGSTGYSGERLQCKVCLKCGKIIDEINNHYIKIKIKEQRRQKAMEIYESKTRQKEMESCSSDR